MGAFSVFDWPYLVQKIPVTAGYTNQTTKAWVPEVEGTAVDIKANVTDLTQKELQYFDPGAVAQGLRRIAIDKSVALKVGDRVKITEADSIITIWVVDKKENFSDLLSKYMGETRETFLLKRKL